MPGVKSEKSKVLFPVSLVGLERPTWNGVANSPPTRLVQAPKSLGVAVEIKGIPNFMPREGVEVGSKGESGAAVVVTSSNKEGVAQTLMSDLLDNR